MTTLTRELTAELTAEAAKTNPAPVHQPQTRLPQRIVIGNGTNLTIEEVVAIARHRSNCPTQSAGPCADAPQPGSSCRRNWPGVNRFTVLPRDSAGTPVTRFRLQASGRCRAIS